VLGRLLRRREDPWLRAIKAAGEADRVLALAATATGARPTRAFVNARDGLSEEERRVAVSMLSAAAGERGEGDGPPPQTGNVLRGLVWIAASAGGEDAARALSAMALTGYHKLPWVGPVSAKAANAAIAALGEMPEGAARLGHLRTRLTRQSAVDALEKAIDRATETLGIPRDEFEESVVPDPAELSAKELKSMTAAQRLRLERLLADERAWTGAAFRERYLEQGLVGPLARRLIWTVDGEAVLGDDIEALADDAEVRLWHPVDAARDGVRAWRERLEAREITQPFKQAHREIYVVTDGERETETYSNRFAAHILRQHQMAALAHSRGWRYALQGDFDGGDPDARLELPRQGLSASFWVERPDEGEQGSTGIYLHVVSDQVRIADAAGPVPLASVPPRVFSEIMRDVDLFVGVTSIGNDPTWGDRGELPFVEYWRGYAFGELTEQATVRAEVLERLLPSLAIADLAEIDGRWLRVRGTLRTYRIHLGSANVLMEPDDAYLCVVVNRASAGAKRVYLPFEGDHVLAVILSKALRLARDDRIDDESILAQIRG
jgi:hypothetical protein